MTKKVKVMVFAVVRDEGFEVMRKYVGEKEFEYTVDGLNDAIKFIYGIGYKDCQINVYDEMWHVVHFLKLFDILKDLEKVA